jgi:predicted glycosyltransferase involved in capsule biosynthesis
MDATLITTCKGRLSHLQETIGFMQSQKNVNYELMVVDYGDPNDVWRFVIGKVPKLDRSSVLVLENTDNFNLNRARNFGARWAIKSDILAFVDADVFLADNWLSTVVGLVRQGSHLVTRVGRTNGITGTFAVTKDLFNRVNGFDERMNGWGHDEVDFFHRCQELEKSCTYNSSLVRAINHSDELRMENYECKDKQETHSRNVALSVKRDKVNPNGYALGRALYYRCPDSPFISESGPLLHDQSPSNLTA